MQITNPSEFIARCNIGRIKNGSIIHDDAGQEYIVICDISDHVHGIDPGSVLRTSDGGILSARWLSYPVGVLEPGERI